MSDLDRRLNAFRPDLVDQRLEGRVAASRFAAGRPARVAVPVLDVRNAPGQDAGLDTQFLLGDEVAVFDEADGFAWVQSARDGYVGYVAAKGLAAGIGRPTHVVAVPRTFAYRRPDMKTPVAGSFSIGSTLRIVGDAETRGTRYLLLETGEALVAAHLRPLDETVEDFVSVAELLERTPYLWGGASAFGIDCSALVQLSMRMSGRAILRDTDMQAGSVGVSLDISDDLSGLRRGDLVFWRGHVAIMCDAQTIIHASGHMMSVVSEPLRAAVDRIAYLYAKPNGFRRP